MTSQYVPASMHQVAIYELTTAPNRYLAGLRKPSNPTIMSSLKRLSGPLQKIGGSARRTSSNHRPQQMWLGSQDERHQQSHEQRGASLTPK